MFGFPRLQKLLAEHGDGASLIDFLLGELKRFTGDGWEQEDDGGTAENDSLAFVDAPATTIRALNRRE